MIHDIVLVIRSLLVTSLMQLLQAVLVYSCDQPLCGLVRRCARALHVIPARVEYRLVNKSVLIGVVAMQHTPAKGGLYSTRTQAPADF